MLVSTGQPSCSTSRSRAWLRARAVDARARDDGRTRGAGQEVDRLLELRLAREGQTGPVALRREQAECGRVADLVHHGRRQLQLHRSGPPGPHLAEREARHLGDPVVAEDRAAPLDGGRIHSELVLPLERGRRRRVDDAEAVLGRDRDEGHALVARGDHTGQEVGRARPRIPEHRGDLAGRLVEARRHVGRRRLVSHRHEPDPVRLERREERVDLRARQPEHEPDPLLRETARQ